MRIILSSSYTAFDASLRAFSNGLLICTLISENQGLEKSRSASNLRKNSGPAKPGFFFSLSSAQSFQSVESRTRLCLHQFCLTHLSLRAKSYKTDAKEVLYEALYEAPLERLEFNRYLYIFLLLLHVFFFFLLFWKDNLSFLFLGGEAH